MMFPLDFLANSLLGGYPSGLFLPSSAQLSTFFHSPLIPIFLFSPQSLQVFDLRASYKPYTITDKGVDFPGFQV